MPKSSRLSVLIKNSLSSSHPAKSFLKVCVCASRYTWLRKQVLSYFKLLLLLYQVEQKGVWWKLLKVGTVLETKIQTVLGTSPRTTFIWSTSGCSPGASGGAIQGYRSRGQRSWGHCCSCAPRPLPVSLNLHFPLWPSQWSRDWSGCMKPGAVGAETSDEQTKM